VDVRIVAATNKDLARAAIEGAFREDLLFRLNVIPIHLPPLRERPDDVPLLVQHFSARYRARTGRPAPVWTDDALAVLVRHRWPGNVRELANIIERLAILHAGEPVTASHARQVLAVDRGTPSDGVPATLPDPSDLGASLNDALDGYERTLIVRALAVAQGNVAEAARRLQTDRPNLYRRMKRLGIQ
jgi:two-component system nitrogen regulation response regulator NtrX